MRTDLAVGLAVTSLVSAGTLLYRTLQHLGHPTDLIRVHHLAKGTNVHSEAEMSKMADAGMDKVVVLDQGSRPGRPLVPKQSSDPRVLIIDHHLSDKVRLWRPPTDGSGQMKPKS